MDEVASCESEWSTFSCPCEGQVIELQERDALLRPPNPVRAVLLVNLHAKVLGKFFRQIAASLSFEFKALCAEIEQ
jgi:hypothetical protein